MNLPCPQESVWHATFCIPSSQEIDVSLSSRPAFLLFWTSGATVHRADNSGGSYSEIGTTGSTSYDNTTSPPAASCYYKAVATHSCGDSPLRIGMLSLAP